MIFCGHKWTPDVNAGWRFCTCLNRCGWVRRVDGDETVYVKDGFEQDFEPICETSEE